jgi:thioesterase domain-containing protein
MNPPPPNELSSKISPSTPAPVASEEDARLKGNIGGGPAPFNSDHVYLRPLRTSGLRPPLFCFFPGPPGARGLANALPNDHPVYEFFYPNLDGATKFPAVEELSAAYIQELRSVCPHGPYQLCGYSRAGILAYDVASSLLSQGADVTFLALFETWHPGFEREFTARQRIQYRMKYMLDRLQKYARDLRRGRLDSFAARLYEGVSWRAKLVLWRAARSFFRSAKRPVPKDLQETESMVTLRAYTPKLYPRRLILVRTNDPFEKRLPDQTFGWHLCASGGVDIRFVGGDHGAMITEPFVRSLAETLLPYLATASDCVGPNACGPTSGLG